jgi:protein tyrosine/serine phosphatase
VSDDLYRGEQPSEEGMRELKKMGIKTIVNLRALHSDRDKMKDNQFKYVNINMKPWHAEDEDVVEFLKVFADKNNAPVFVHCQHGSDRTGMLCAIYRMAVEGWSREGAIEEMVQGGYGFHEDWTNLVAYLRHVDVERLKKKAGMAP